MMLTSSLSIVIINPLVGTISGLKTDDEYKPDEQLTSQTRDTWRKIRLMRFWVYLIAGTGMFILGALYIPLESLSLGLIGSGVLNIFIAFMNNVYANYYVVIILLILLGICIALAIEQKRKELGEPS